MTYVDVFAELADVDVFLERVLTVDLAATAPVTVEAIIPPVTLVDVIVDLPGATGNRVTFGDLNYLFFGDQVIYGSN